ncbi:unnamed protein product [Paramecium pentaurelia]|uniref:Protein kinase domain-containing protein n=1 Tax=Paramecium pentaurelia TaxID=43138 RepID=A0A8S1XZX9_9CILI|nr:unnamed protein product [Paramecium pentaurelia]
MINQQVIEKDDALRTFFSESDHQKLVPRSLFVNLEPTLIDEVKTGKFKDMLSPEQFVSGKDGAANNFGRGHYSIGKEYVDICLERIRKLADNCSSVQGFMMFNSVGGGTGSGLGTLLLEKLSVDYCKKSRLNINIYPSAETSVSMVEPYNSIFATQSQLEHTDVCVTMDNQAIYDICKNKLDIETPKYSNLNRMIAQVISSITCSMRFDGGLFTDLTELYTCQVQLSTVEISNLAFETENMMAKCDPKQGKSFSIISLVLQLITFLNSQILLLIMPINKILKNEMICKIESELNFSCTFKFQVLTRIQFFYIKYLKQFPQQHQVSKAKKNFAQKVFPLKIEKQPIQGQIESNIKILKELNKIEGILNLIEHGKAAYYKGFLMMPQLNFILHIQLKLKIFLHLINYIIKILHLDVKPDNIMVTKTIVKYLKKQSLKPGIIQLIDFGFSKTIDNIKYLQNVLVGSLNFASRASYQGENLG